MATRYNQKTKDKVVTFIKGYNEKNGRGGQSAAVEKFGINPITIRSWMDKAGLPAPNKKSSNPTPKKKKTPSAISKASNPVRTLRRMTEIQESIESLQEEYLSLKDSL